MAYVNFVLALTEQPDGKYQISVLESPVGETSVTVDNPFNAASIREAIELVTSDAGSASRFAQTRAARQLGQQLFNFLIRQNDDINAAYFASLDRAGSDWLRIRLSLERAGLLAALPWELLADPQRDFLALSRTTPVVRYTRQLTTRAPVPVTLPLRVLVMISAPDNFPALDVEGEWNRLNEATASLQKRGILQLERLDDATLIALQRRLRAQDFHVFHYIGHSAFDERAQEGVLALEQEDGESGARLISGAALASELGEESTIRLVVLNSCDSARYDGESPFSGIASSLVQRGIPAVVAMQYQISDGAAAAFAEEFYRAIAETLPIDSAISEARRAIANRTGSLEWVTPVLYMRSADGVLFRLTEQRLAEAGWLRRLLARPPLLALLAIVIVLLAGAAAALLNRPPGPLPNLEIVSIRSSPVRPAPGEAFRLLISIRNSGDADSGPFNWTWDASPVDLNVLEDRIENLPAGATQNISFPYSYGWWGSYSSHIFVDADGEVLESDERDNRVFPVIELDPTSAFRIDFTLLPNNEIVTTPHALAGDEFRRWNLNFALGGGDACREETLHIVSEGNRNMLTALEAADGCRGQPLIIDLDEAVGRATAEVLATTMGQARISYFDRPDASEPVFQSPPLPVTAGQAVTLGANDGINRTIRRIVIHMTNEPVRLRTLTLFPPGA